MATYYVSTTGNDASAGTASGTAWATIARALDSGQATYVHDGDTLLIEAGTYTENPVIKVAGSINSTIRVLGMATGFATPAAGARPVIVNGTWSTTLSAGTAAYYRFEGISVTGQTATAWNLGNLSFCSWRWCTASNNTGASTDGFSARANSTFFSCIASGNGRDGFAMGGNTGGSLNCFACTANDNARYGFHGYTNHQYNGCVAHNNSNSGFYSAIGNTQVWCTNCTADGNGVGYNLRGGRDCTLLNCLVTNNTTGVVGEVGNLSEYNIFYGNTADTSTWTLGATDRTATDPLYTNRAGDDFTLASGSPARQTGHPAYMDVGALQAQASAGGAFGGFKLGGML